jgi:hypothetical protein
MGAGVALIAPRSGARTAWRPGVIVLVASTALMSVAWPYPADAPLAIPPAEMAALGPVADFSGDILPPYSVSAGSSTDELGRTVYQQSFENLNGWHDFTAELWPLERVDGGWRFAAAPMLTVPYETAGLNFRAREADPRPRVPVWSVRLGRATSADGVRMIGPGAFQAERTQPWNGSVLEWWLGR